MHRLLLILSLIAVLGASTATLAQDQRPEGAPVEVPICVRIVTADGAPFASESTAEADPEPSAAPSASPSAVDPDPQSPEPTGEPVTDGSLDVDLAEALADGSARLMTVPAEECAPTADGSPTDAGLTTNEADATDPPGEADATPRADREGRRRTPYARFVARGVAAVVDFAKLVRQNDGAVTQDEVASAARALQRWADGQRRWLRNHPPQRCYRAAHRRWLRGISTISKGARDLRFGVLELDARRAARGTRLITSGYGGLSSIDLDTTSKRCVRAAARR